MIYFQQNEKEAAIKNAAMMIMNAARTAPKTKGEDNLVILFTDKEETGKIGDEMIKAHKEEGAPEHFERDGLNLKNSSGMILIGTPVKPLGVGNCGLCGYENCGAKPSNVPCMFNSHDLGLAVGSAVYMMSEMKIDNRIMFSAGKIAVKMGIMGEDVKIAMGIPMSVEGKNIFFDRKPKK